METLLRPGTLWERTLLQSERSLASGEREPLETELHEIVDGDETFVVRVAVGRDRKWSTTKAQRAAGIDPFMPPYDGELFVADLTDTHVALLNKFNAVEGHLLIVTRAYEPQEAPLGDADFAALWLCMRELEGRGDGLGFYNSGPDAGASQPHKHLQLVALPSLYAGRSTRAAGSLPVCAKPADDAPCYAFSSASLPPLPDAPAEAGAGLAALYRRLLADAELSADAPYNLLLTRERMVVVPRTRSGWRRCGVNGMGYAGSLLLHHAEDLAWLREVGPCALLTRAGRAERDGGGAS